MVRRLVTILLALAVGILRADELDVARQALRDGLWEIARLHVSTQTSDAAKLIVLESYAGEGKWDEIRSMLETCAQSTGPAFDYYRAVAAGKHDQAQRVLASSGDQVGIVEAKMYEADTLAGAGDLDGAKKLWRDVAASTNVGERASVLSAVNLMDRTLLEKVLPTVKSSRLRRLAAVRLGRLLVADPAERNRGETLIRSVVRDSPDTDGARDAFIAIADAAVAASEWKQAFATYGEIAEIWPDAQKIAAVHEGRGWALAGLGRFDDALSAFHRAAELATDDGARATAVMKEGDMLSELGRGEESMAKYREVIDKYPKTMVAERLRKVVRVRELESKGRDLYKMYDFTAARKQFQEVAAADPSRRPQMEFFEVLCLYGSGDDKLAIKGAERLVAECPDAKVRSEATLWLAKFRYNRREWKESRQLFSRCEGPDALMWAARAAFAENDFKDVIACTSSLLEKFPNAKFKPDALQLQGEALMELARFDEAVLVLDRVAMVDSVSDALRLRAATPKADCLYAMGADNAARYNAALKAYNAIRFSGSLDQSGQVVMAFKIARTLEKLKRIPEAMDQYYSQVVLAYRSHRLQGVQLNDEARAAFSKAAFRLADEYESLGRDQQAMNVLQLVVMSDVPAAEEARQRIDRISEKGRFL